MFETSNIQTNKEYVACPDVITSDNTQNINKIFVAQIFFLLPTGYFLHSTYVFFCKMKYFALYV